MAKCWKVVSVRGGRIRSARMPTKSRRACLFYEVGKTTVALFGGCLCFHRLREAVAFASTTFRGDPRPLRVHQAEGTHSVRLPKIAVNCYSASDILEGSWSALTGVSDGGFPTGTVAYREVTLIRQVWPKPKGASDA